jgi:bifunctional DNA-binding transcriptional regulator/antitoxin component of YhaV-PrlF toxin-antitoxin module
MAKVTSKLQLTLPKAIADQYKIRPGDDLDWLPAGEAIRVIKRSAAESAQSATLEQRLHLFDEATARQTKRERTKKMAKAEATGRAADRGWTREEIYRRGLPR